MRSTYTALMQSKYFSPAFNSAIFDGPIRIYFAQFHESAALKIYLMLQQALASDMAVAKDYSKAFGANFLIMMYPTQDSFVLSFEEEDLATGMVMENWDDDVVIGINGVLDETQVQPLIDMIRAKIKQWEQELANSALPEATL